MPVFLPGPLTSRTWAIPLPVSDPRGGARLRRAAEGRTILVTGASSGIGEIAAMKFGEAGADAARRAHAERLNDVAARIAADGGEAHTHPADLADPPRSDRLVAEVLEQHGGVDVLVNNAGRSIRRPVRRSVERPHDYERTMALNYFGPLRLILGFLPAIASTGAARSSTSPRWACNGRAAVLGVHREQVRARRVHARARRRGRAPGHPLHHGPHAARPHADDRADARVYDRVPALTPEAGRGVGLRGGPVASVAGRPAARRARRGRGRGRARPASAHDERAVPRRILTSDFR